MADIRINGLPLATGPTAPAPTDVVAIDGTTTRKSVLSDLANAIRPVASQAEAQVGTNATKTMTPLTTAQAIVAQVSTVGISGDYNDLASKPTLGTASAEDSTAFATAAQGTLASSALQAGSFGLGRGTAGSPTLITNIDDTTLPNGFYQAQTTTTGTLPNASAQGIVLIERYSGTWVKQTWTNRADASSGTRGGLTFSRVYNNTTATWGAWVQVISSGQKATSPQAVTGTDDTNYTTSLAVAAAIDGRSSVVITGGLSRTAPARFGDTIDIKEFGFNVSGSAGTQAANNTALSKLITHSTAFPGMVYKARKGDRIAFGGSGYNAQLNFPANLKLRTEDATFAFTGAMGSSPSDIFVFGANLDADSIRLEIEAGSTFRRAVRFGSNTRVDFVSLESADEIDNTGGSLTDGGIRVQESFTRIGEIRARRVGKPVIIYGVGDGNPNVGSYIGYVDIENYGQGMDVRNVTELTLNGGRIRTRQTAVPTLSVGYNGLLFEGISRSTIRGFEVADSLEHGIRFGGTRNNEELTYSNTVSDIKVINARQTGLKMYVGEQLYTTQRIRKMNVSNIQCIDCGNNDGSPPGPNFFGFLLQGLQDSNISNITAATHDRSHSGFDGIYISQAENVSVVGAQVSKAFRNAVRISHYNDFTALNEVSSDRLRVFDLSAEASGAESVYIECPGTANMRDIHVINADINGGTDGIRWDGSANRASQPAYLSALIRGQSGAKFNVPGDVRIKTVDLFDPSVSVTYDPPSLVDGAGVTTTLTFTGAGLGDYAVASFSLDLQGITLTAWVSAANTISVRFQNETGGTIDLASGTLRGKVIKP